MTLASFIHPRDVICVSYAHTAVLFIHFGALFTFGGGTAREHKHNLRIKHCLHLGDNMRMHCDTF